MSLLLGSPGALHLEPKGYRWERFFFDRSSSIEARQLERLFRFALRIANNACPRYIMLLGRVFRPFFFCRTTRRLPILETTELDRGLHESSLFLFRGRDNAEFFVNPESRNLRLP